ETAVESATLSALRREINPLVILDDVEQLDYRTETQLRRSTTGARFRSTASRKTGFRVEESGTGDSLYVITSINLPTNRPLLSRAWFFHFDRKFFQPQFKNNLDLRQRIVGSRSELMSLLLDVIARAFAINEADGLPDPSEFGPLPVERTAIP